MSMSKKKPNPFAGMSKLPEVPKDGDVKMESIERAPRKSAPKSSSNDTTSVDLKAMRQEQAQAQLTSSKSPAKLSMKSPKRDKSMKSQDSRSGKSTAEDKRSGTKSASKRKMSPKIVKQGKISKSRADAHMTEETKHRQEPVRKSDGVKHNNSSNQRVKKQASSKIFSQERPLTLPEEIHSFFQKFVSEVSVDETQELVQRFATKAAKKCQCCFEEVKLPVTKRDKVRLDYMSWFYKMAFCKKCEIGCHVMCLGQPQLQVLRLPTEEGQPRQDVFLFNCGCDQERTPCVVCKQSKGFMRKVGDLFVHQVCAIVKKFPLIDPFTMDFGQPTATEEDNEQSARSEHIAAVQKKSEEAKVCQFCKQGGGLVGCQVQLDLILLDECTERIGECIKYAHPYCALASKKEPWKLEIISEIRDEKGEPIRPNLKQRQEATQGLRIRWICSVHEEAQSLCFQCSDPFPGGTEMPNKLISCEFCNEWVHNICQQHYSWMELQDLDKVPENYEEQLEMAQDFEYKGFEQYKCPKCAYWFDFLKTPKVKSLIGCGTESLEVKLNGEMWRDSWFPPLNLQLIGSKLHEQLLFARLWTSQLHRMRDFKCTKGFVETQIKQASLMVLNLAQQKAELNQIISQSDSQSQDKELVWEEAKLELDIYRDKAPLEIIDFNQSNPNQQFQFSVHEENDNKNNEILKTMKKLQRDNSLENMILMVDQALEVEILIRKLETLTRAKQLLFSQQLIKYEDLQLIVRDFDELGFRGCNSYKILHQFLKNHEAWQREVLNHCVVPEIVDEYRYQLNKMRERYRGLELAQERYKYLTEIFKPRSTVQHLREALHRDIEQFPTDLTPFIRLREKQIEQIEKYYKSAISYIGKAADKPLIRMRELFVQMAGQPVKPENMDVLLKVWLESAEWNSYAKSFVAEKLNHNMVYQFYRTVNTLMRQDNKDKASKKTSNQSKSKKTVKSKEDNTEMAEANESDHLLGLRDPQLEDEELKKKFIFTEQDIVKLIGRTKIGAFGKLEALITSASQQTSADVADSLPIVFDKRLLDLVIDKYNTIKDIKASEKEIREHTGNVEELQKYIEICSQIDNFDLTHYENIAREKLDVIKQCLLVTQVNAVVEGTDEAKTQSLKKLQQKVLELKTRKEDPIFIPDMLEMMLESKVQISEQLKREFQDTLKSGADSFNKQMIIDLRKIVQKATKEHGLAMDKERRIVDNLGRSEEWFVETFAQLKRLCGHALHQIDFKDYQQLHSVIKSAKDCDQLLRAKEWKPQVIENLVGAAKNLYLSLQGAKWLFEVKQLLDRSNGVKEFSQLLSLYYRAKEINLDLGAVEHQELVDEETMTYANYQVLTEFARLSKVAVEFDNMFGTHQKIIDTLERYEKDSAIKQLLDKVDSLQDALLHTFSQSHSNEVKQEGKGFVIQTLNEQEVLQKVRSYIKLNQDYQNFINKQENNETVQDEQEVVFDDSKLFEEEAKVQPVPEVIRISYAKALRLQQQARQSLIPEDIPVLKRLNNSVLRFEKFKKRCAEYARFRERIKQKGVKMLSQALIQQSVQNQTLKKIDVKPQTQVPKSLDAEFSLAFVNDLVQESINLEIEIPADIFNRGKIMQDLETFHQWREDADSILEELEDELQHRNFKVAKEDVEDVDMIADFEEEPKTKAVSEDILTKFANLKDRIKELPLFDSSLFLRIQAFEWLLGAKALVDKGSKGADEKFIFSLPYWENMYSQHEQFIRSLPILKDHPILQRMMWEIERARKIVDFVSKQKHIIKSNQGKFLSEQYQNYVAFRTKHSPAKIESLLELARKTKVDISEEIASLTEWIDTYTKYQEMVKNKTMFVENKYEQVKLIQKHIYLSPIEYGDLYFTIGKRLDIAQSIRNDLRQVFEDQKDTNEAQHKKTRIKFSRVAFGLNHFEMNCQIPGIAEVEKIQGQIASSRAKIAEALQLLKQCSSAAPEDQIKLREAARKITSTLELDMEQEELPLIEQGFKIQFSLWTSGHQTLDVEQIKNLDKEFKKVQTSLESSDKAVAEKYLELKQNVIKCLKMIKRCETKEDLETTLSQQITELCPSVDFTQELSDKRAKLHLQKEKMQDAARSQRKGTIAIDMASARKANQVSSSSDESESSSGESDDESSGSSSSEESSEEVMVFKKDANGKIIKVSSKQEQSSSSSSSGSSSSGSQSSSSGSASSSQEEASANVEQASQHASQQASADASDASEEAESEMEDMEEEQEEMPELSGHKRSKAEKDDIQQSAEDDEDLEAKFNALTEEQKQFLDEQLRKRQQKKKAKAAAKLAAQQFEAQQAKQQKLRDARKSEEEGDGHLGLKQDQSLMQSIQQVREKARMQCKEQLVSAMKRLDECLLSQPDPVQLFEPAFGVTKMQIMVHFMTVIESKVFEKFPHVDQNYRRKITDVCVNIKQIQSYPEIADLFFNKACLSCFVGRYRGEQKSMIKQLYQGALFFRDVLQQQQRLRDERKPIKKIDSLQALKQKGQRIDIKNDRDKVAHDVDAANNDRTAEARRPDYQSCESSGESHAGPTSARFSDDDEQKPSMLSKLSTSNVHLNPAFDDNLRQVYVPHQMYKYNPFLVLQLQAQGGKVGAQLPFNIHPTATQAPQSEPILYDPIKQFSSGQMGPSSNIKNIAKPGSLLKVWEGQLQTSSTQPEQAFQVQLFSTGDIRNFQTLPDLPNVLTLKGKSVLKEVMTHFVKLRQEIHQAKLKKTNLASHFILKGWVTRKRAGQSNSDNYTSHFDTLEQNQRCSVCPLFKGVNIYLVPVIPETKLFCKQMGVVPLKLQNGRNKGQSLGLEEETQYFAFFCHIKSAFTKKLSILNPSVICHLDDMQRVAKKHQKQPQPVVQPLIAKSQPQVINLIQPAVQLTTIKEDPEDDEDERELDRLIAQFRTQGITNIEEIQQKLLPIIEKFSGTGRKEEKLEAFLKEVIEKMNSQQQQPSASHVDQSHYGGYGYTQASQQNYYGQSYSSGQPYGTQPAYQQQPYGSNYMQPQQYNQYNPQMNQYSQQQYGSQYFPGTSDYQPQMQYSQGFQYTNAQSQQPGGQQGHQPK